MDCPASVEREHYVGKGPWQIAVVAGYIPTISDDPRLLYQDVLVGLATDRGINNGQPSLHATFLDACSEHRSVGDLVYVKRFSSGEVVVLQPK